MTTKPTKPIKLKINNAAEDVPQLVMGAGPVCMGALTLVLRPHPGEGILIVEPPAEGKGRGRSAPTPLVWASQGGISTPEVPVATNHSVGDLIATVKRLASAPTRLGPIAAKGQWSGTLECEDGRPRLTFVRTLGYVRVTLFNVPSGRWHIRIKRDEAWFGRQQEIEVAAKGASLAEAMREAIAGAVGVAAEVCGLKDTTRRGSIDNTAPAPKPAKVSQKDPVSRWTVERPPKAEKAPKAENPSKSAPRWEYFVHNDEAPEVDSVTPGAADRRLITAMGLRYDADRGDFFGVTTEPFEDWPTGSAYFAEGIDENGFWLALRVASTSTDTKEARAPKAAKPAKPAQPAAPPKPAAPRKAAAPPKAEKPGKADKDAAIMSLFERLIAQEAGAGAGAV